MVSFGHAAYFGLGAYAAALLLLRYPLPMEWALLAAPLAALAGAAVFGWLCVRLSGIYLAMLTLALAQIVWSVAFQWDAVTGGSNGLVGIWPAPWLASRTAYYYAALAFSAASIACLWRILASPFGNALRASRDSPVRAEAIGIDVRAQRWTAFMLAGTAAGLAGALFAFSKGSISPETLSVPRSVDGLVMVLLGGVQTLTGPVWGAALFTWLEDALAREIAYWRAAIGAVILLLVLAFPQGIAGAPREMALSVRNLSKAYGGVQAVRDVSFSVAPGEVVAIIGPNGAGKTTCFNMLNGQLAPDRGDIRLDGTSLVGLPPHRVSRLGVGRTFQVTATFGSMSVRENVQTALLSHHRRNYSMWSRARKFFTKEAEALLDRVGMRGAGRPAVRRARLWRPQARGARHGARQRAAPSAHGRADRGNGPGGARHADGACRGARAA